MATRNNEEKKTALAVVQDPAAFLPSAEELAVNPRSRSAKLRVCEKL